MKRMQILFFVFCSALVFGVGCVGNVPPAELQSKKAVPSPSLPKEVIEAKKIKITREPIAPYSEYSGPGQNLEVRRGFKYTITNEDCVQDNSCNVKSFVLEEEKYVLPSSRVLPYDTFSTRARVAWNAPGHKDDFMIVQFVRGRKWDTVVKQDGTYIDYPAWENIVFVPIRIGTGFPLWVLFVKGDCNDSFDNDFDGLADMRDPGCTSTTDGSELSNKNNEKAVVEVYPAGSYFNPAVQYPGAKRGIAHNTAFALKTCLYRASDLPANISEEAVKNLMPIMCIEWSSAFVYDFNTRRMNEIHDLDSLSWFMNDK